MTQIEFYKSFQFIAELLAAEGVFCFRLERHKFFILRFFLCLAATFTFSFFFPVLTENELFLSFMFFVLFAFTIFMAKIMFNESWMKVVFCCFAGYTVQHLAYEIYNLLLVLMGESVHNSAGMYGDQSFSPFPNAFIAIVYFYVYILVYLLAAKVFGKRIIGGEKIQIKSGFVFVFGIILLCVDVILNAVVLYNIPTEGNGFYLFIVGIYNILCCIVILILLFEVSLRYRLEDTLNKVNLLRHKEKKQYETAKETIELINMKCHDLKHQIRMIGNRSSLSESSLKEINDLILIYDANIQTGNAALDIILTEKRLHCNKYGIQFSCIVDGKRLDFMRDEDIYSLFGNLIDNAVEAVQSLEEGKRVIGLKIRAVNNLLSVNINNYYEKDLSFEDGIPRTTKKETRYHGYGLKSAQYICHKYGGDFSINAEKNIFTVNILFSLKGGEEG